MNKKLATLALTIALSGFGGAVAFAQDDAQGQQPPAGAGQGGGGGRRWAPQDPEMQIKHMQAQLGLTPDQVNQIRPILVEARSQQQAARQDSSLVGQDRMAKMQSIREGTETKVMAILTSDQQTKYQQMRAQMMQRGRPGAGGGPGGQDTPSNAPTAPPQ